MNLLNNQSNKSLPTLQQQKYSITFVNDLKKQLQNIALYQISNKKITNSKVTTNQIESTKYQNQKQRVIYKQFDILMNIFKKDNYWITTYTTYQSCDQLIIAVAFQRNYSISKEVTIRIYQFFKNSSSQSTKYIDVFQSNNKNISYMKFVSYQNQMADQSTTLLKLFVGLQDGQVIILQFGQQQIKQSNIKIDFKLKIVDIVHYQYNSLSFIFILNSQLKLYAINISNHKTFAILSSNVQRKGLALKISFNNTGELILIGADNGNCIIWDISQSFLEAYTKSQSSVFKAKDIYYSASPRSIFSSAGGNHTLKHIQFWGQFLFTLNSNGQVKWILIDMTKTQSFVEILAYKIKQGSKINYMMIAAQHQFFMFSRKSQNTIQKVRIIAPNGKLDLQSPKLFQHDTFNINQSSKGYFKGQKSAISIDKFSTCIMYRFLMVQNRGYMSIALYRHGFENQTPSFQNNQRNINYSNQNRNQVNYNNQYGGNYQNQNHNQSHNKRNNYMDQQY